MQEQPLDTAKTRVALLFLLALAVTALFFWVIKGFVLALLMAVVLAGVMRPVYRKLVDAMHGRKSAAAGLTVVMTLAVVIVPALLFLAAMVHQAAQFSEQLGPWIETHLQSSDGPQEKIQDNPVLKRFLPYQNEIVDKASQLAGQAASFVAGGLISGTRATAAFLLKLFIALFAMFCFLKDGRAILDWVFERMPLTNDDQERLIGTFTSVSQATLKGTVVIGVIQGGLAAAAFAAAEIEGVFFWGAIMALLSIIPAGVGSALVWLPAVVYLAMNGRIGTAVALAAWCGIVVGTADNFLRPVLVGRETKMPDLMVLLTTLGGLVLFGAAGIVIGPIVGALFTTVWALWGAAMDEAQRDDTSTYSEHAH